MNQVNNIHLSVVIVIVLKLRRFLIFFTIKPHIIHIRTLILYNEISVLFPYRIFTRYLFMTMYLSLTCTVSMTGKQTYITEIIAVLNYLHLHNLYLQNIVRWKMFSILSLGISVSISERHTEGEVWLQLHYFAKCGAICSSKTAERGKRSCLASSSWSWWFSNRHNYFTDLNSTQLAGFILTFLKNTYIALLQLLEQKDTNQLHVTHFIIIVVEFQYLIYCGWNSTKVSLSFRHMTHGKSHLWLLLRGIFFFLHWNHRE